MLYFTIYKTTNLLNGKTYIGQHITEDLENDPYIGGGTHFKRAVRKYGKENFSREWIFIFDNFEEMDNKEAELVDEEYILEDDNYNHKTGGKQAGKYHENSKKQISESLKKYFKENPDVQRGKKKKPLREEAKARISNTLKERYENQVHHLKGTIAWNKGVKTGKPSWNTGISTGPMSEEQKIQISKTLKEKYVHKEHHRKGKPSWNAGKRGQLPASWNKGITMPKSNCEHCNKSVDTLNLRRWHGDNCKLNPVNLHN